MDKKTSRPFNEFVTPDDKEEKVKNEADKENKMKRQLGHEKVTEDMKEMQRIK